MTYEEYSERLSSLQREIAKASEAQRQSQLSGNHAENMWVQAKIAELMIVVDELRRDAREAGLAVE